MKKVLVLGGGYASMAFLKNLSQSTLSQAEFTLISQTPSHYMSVLLHECVSENKNISLPFSEILPSNVRFVCDCVREIKKGVVICDKESYEYDSLVVGLGFASDDFGIKGIKEYAHPMVNATNCQELHTLIHKKLQDKTTQNLSFVVCGGGFSGIELIASLAEELPHLCQKYNLDSETIKLTCIEAMPQVLPMFPSTLTEKAVAYLKAQGVQVEVGAKILEVKEKGVLVEQNSEQRVIDSDLTFWSAGVKGNEVIAASSFFTSGRSKVEVNTFLQPINQENQEAMAHVFIIGDCAALKDPQSGRFYPPTAQMAQKQGEYLAQIFHHALQGEAITQEFSFTSRGTICSLGSKYAIGLVGEKQFDGKMAIWIKRYIEFKWVAKLKGFVGAIFG